MRVIQLQIRTPLAPVAGLLFRLRVNTEREGWADVFCLDTQPPDNTKKHADTHPRTLSAVTSPVQKNMYKKIYHRLRVKVGLFDLVIATLSKNVQTASVYQSILAKITSPAGSELFPRQCGERRKVMVGRATHNWWLVQLEAKGQCNL